MISKIWQNARKLRNNATPEEQKLWWTLRDRSLFPFPFRRQYAIGQYIADFYCHAAKLVIELDGSQHAGEKQATYDLKRTRFMEEQGIFVVRFWNFEIKEEFDALVEHLLQIVEERTREG